MNMKETGADARIWLVWQHSRLVRAFTTRALARQFAKRHAKQWTRQANAAAWRGAYSLKRVQRSMHVQPIPVFSTSTSK